MHGNDNDSDIFVDAVVDDDDDDDDIVGDVVLDHVDDGVENVDVDGVDFYRAGDGRAYK